MSFSCCDGMRLIMTWHSRMCTWKSSSATTSQVCHATYRGTHVYIHVYTHAYTHVYIHVNTHVCMHVCAHVYTHVCSMLYACLRICLYTCLRTCLYTRLFACLYPRVCACLYACLRACLYTYRFAHIDILVFMFRSNGNVIHTHTCAPILEPTSQLCTLLSTCLHKYLYACMKTTARETREVPQFYI